MARRTDGDGKRVRRYDAQGNPLPLPGEVDLWGDGPLGYENLRRQRGRGVPIGGPGNKDREIVLMTGGEGSVGDSMAGLCAITLGYQDGNEANETVPQYVQGEIEWGTDGVQNKAIVDYINGTVLHLSASSFRVIARVAFREPESGEGGIPTESIALVSASIGYWGGGNCRPQLTQQATAQDFGEGVRARFRAPAYACEFTAISSADPQAIWRIQEGAGTIGNFTPANADVRLPVPGVAQFLELAGIPPGDTVTVVWYLSI